MQLLNFKDMRALTFILICFFFGTSQYVYADKKKDIPKDDKWDKTDDRENDSPQLYQDDSNVYVYSEKQLDNLYIGITDMQGNIFCEETTTVPAGMYYAIPIESLPQGMYYLSIIQGGNYVIGIFMK